MLKLFKSDIVSIKSNCDLYEYDCSKCELNKNVEVYISDESHAYIMTICDLLENVTEY